MLQTYNGSNLNQVSEKVLNYLEEKKLKPGETVKYRWLNGTLNIDPNRRKGDDWIYNSAITLTFRDRIKDPGKGVPVEIGLVDSYDQNTKQYKFKHKVFTPYQDQGMFSIRENILDEHETYPLVELSNKNASNPFRDTSEPALFERVDDVRESKAKSKKRNYLFDSLKAIRGWKDHEVIQVAAGHNQSTTLPVDILRNRLEEIAEKDPEGFYNSIESDDLFIRSIIKMAQEKELIRFNPVENKWSYTNSDETLALLDRREGVTETEQFVEFLKNSANGPAIREKLQKDIKAKK